MSAKAMKVKRSTGDKVFDIVNYTFLIFLTLIVLYPLVYVLSASFSSPYAVTSGQVWLFPKDVSLVGYETVFKDPNIVSGFFYAVYRTVLGTLIGVVMTMMAAYPLSVRDFAGRGVFMKLLTFTMMFGGGLIPSFLNINELGLYGTYWALVIPGAVGVYNVIVTRTFIQSTIPYDLYESASLDGCSDLGYFLKVVIPLSKPILAVLTMYVAVGHWNDYFNAMIYLKSDNYPLQVVLRNIILMNQIDPENMADVDTMMKMQGLAELLKYSLIVISSVPMLILYPFIQKHFVKGVMIGAIKG
ncbi:carbohydrate ABC transporter permease [Anaeromassilibacillus sp. An200]|uniref:Carbohydrate ABC transporter permease n=1 Tax=Candidatus Caccousia avicola TaxID=2840721 RepID=A0A9D1DFH3_9FIRM|nr:carbohydrate ABC transporter permease [Anaeromassilibacillus sp. An200]OUP13278.1 sugar ABC transporter permease [Anaeromassilibacillus sp. An200]HIR46949.1 carbohydrate ABC transporter permease [Candidatus Caccousia avicola]